MDLASLLANPAVTTAIQGGIAGGQAIAGKVAENKSKALEPVPVNAYDQRMYTMLQREIQGRKNAALGTRGAAISKAMKLMGKNMFKTGRIDYGTLQAAQNQMSANALEATGSELMNYFQMLQKQSTDIADYQTERAMYQSTKADARQASLRKSANMNLGTFFGQNAPIGEDQV